MGRVAHPGHECRVKAGGHHRQHAGGGAGPAAVAGLDERVEELVRRGQSEGVFRADLPPGWLVSVLHHLLKGAAADIGSGRLDPADAPHFIVATVLAAYANSGEPWVIDQFSRSRRRGRSLA